MKTAHTTFEEIVDVTEEYLGPAARRFVSRQITFHLSKEPEAVTPDDIPELVEWMRVTMSMLTQDKTLVVEYSAKIQAIMEEHS